MNVENADAMETPHDGNREKAVDPLRALVELGDCRGVDLELMGVMTTILNILDDVMGRSMRVW